METLILVCVIALLLFSMILLILSRYKKCPSDKVMVIYGKVGSNKDGSCLLYTSIVDCLLNGRSQIITFPVT